MSFTFKTTPSFDSLIFIKPGPAISIFSKWFIFFNNNSLMFFAKLLGFNLLFLANTRETFVDKSKLK